MTLTVSGIYTKAHYVFIGVTPSVHHEPMGFKQVDISVGKFIRKV